MRWRRWDRMNVTIEEIVATRLADRQAGMERLMCGCVIASRDGTPVTPCGDMDVLLSEATAIVRGGMNLTAERLARVGQLQKSIKEHVRKGRASVRKAEQK